MANVDAPHGFRPLYNYYGGEVGRPNSWSLAAANALIGIGDILVKTAAGAVDRHAAGEDGDLVVGVAAQAAAASAGGTILVWDNPGIVYEAQTDNGATVLIAQTAMHLNSDVVVAAAVNGISQMEIDESLGATTNTLTVKILRLWPGANNAFGEFNRLECMMNVYQVEGI